MATKTISLDIEAYDRLCAVRREHESFSEAIKRVVRRPLRPDELMEVFTNNPLSPSAAEAVKRQVARRRRSKSRGSRGVP